MFFRFIECVYDELFDLSCVDAFFRSIFLHSILNTELWKARKNVAAVKKVYTYMDEVYLWSK